MSAQEIATEAIGTEFRKLPPDLHPDEVTVAEAVLEALKANGYAVIRVPEVAHKGPHDTEASMYQRAGWNLYEGYALGGGNLTRAVSQLLINVAQAMA